jgi:type II secretory pathway component PulM
MRGPQHRVSSGGPRLARPRAGRVYRGSAKRIRRINWRDHTPREFVVLVVVGIAMVLVLISWFITHPDNGHHHHADTSVDPR